MDMGLVITPLTTPRRFDPLAQPLEAPQKLGGRELVWRFDGGDITSDGGALVLKKLEERTGIVRRFAACFTDYRKADQIEHPLLDLLTKGKGPSGRTARPKVPMGPPGADCSEVAMKRGNARGAKGAGHPHRDRKGQRETGGTRWS